MKLVRYGDRGFERPGLVDADGKIRDLSGALSDLSPGVLSPAALEELSKLSASSLPEVKGDVRLGVPAHWYR